MRSEWFYRSMDYPERLDYYQNHYKPWLPPQWQWRMIFFLVDGKGRKLRIHKTNNPEEELRKLLVEHLPEQAYYRTSSFLNCDQVAERKNGDRYLGGDLVFDIDSPSLEEAREEAKKLLAYLKTHGYPTPELRFSGHKGYHIVINEFFKGKTEIEVLKESKEIRDEVLANGIKIDKEITADSRRVIGLPNTIHGTTGNRRAVITLTDLLSNAEPEQVVPGKPARVNDMGRAEKPVGNPRTLKGGCAEAGTMRSPELGTSCLRTRGRHIFVRKIPKGRVLLDTTGKAVGGLPHFYIFDTDQGYYLVSLAAMTMEQLKYRHKQEFLPIGKCIYFHQSRPTPLCSRGHYEAFKKLGYPLPEISQFCGSKTTKIFTPKVVRK